MIEFIEAMRQHAFMRHALLTGLLASVACGVIGSYVVVRRISYIAGGIAHCVLGGIGAALYLRTVHGWTALHPTVGAMAAGLAAAVVIGVVTLRARQRQDTVIGALWAAGMAAGVMFISRTPGYAQDAMSYLFGDILMVTRRDLYLICALDACVVIAGLVFYNQFLAVCFDEEFARLRGASVEGYFVLLLCLAALTVVLLATVVGVVMVIALLTLPAAVAGHFVNRLWHMMVFATLFSMAVTAIGLGASYARGLPAGATIIVFAAVVYLLVAVGHGVLVRRRSSVARRPG